MNHSVKSAIRVLEILEYFDRHRHEATVTQIARELRYPQSSTSVLLQSLIETGYLQRGTLSKTFFPTLRVAVLGSWMAPGEPARSEVLALMQHLGRLSGQTVILAAQCNGVVRYVHVVPAAGPAHLHVGPGTFRPLVTSGTGRLFLSAMNEEQVRRTVARHNAAESDDRRRVGMAVVRQDLDEIRRSGRALSLSRITPGVGLVCVALPGAAGPAPHALAIAGPAATIEAGCDVYVRLMREGIARFLGHLCRSPEPAAASVNPRRNGGQAPIRAASSRPPACARTGPASP
ncbi:MAG: IclR family transcriptional regulator [Burkholderiaceae bacterium]